MKEDILSKQKSGPPSSFSQFTFLEKMDNVLLGNTERPYDLRAFNACQVLTDMPQALNRHGTEYSVYSGVCVWGGVNSQLC